MPGWKADMVDLVDYAFTRLRTRLEGLTDEEYLWEPVAGCWSIRSDEGGTYQGEWEDGVWPAPFTTIAWRIGHLINNLFDPRYATQLGLEPQASPPDALPGSAAEALALLEAGFAVTRRYLQAVSEESLHEIMGPVAGPWADDDKGAFVLHMIDELIHHGAEVGVLRDLYRTQGEPNPAVDALLSGDRAAVAAAERTTPGAVARARSEHPDLLLRATAIASWAAIPVLLEAGFPMAMPDGTSALHHAAAGGSVDAVRELLDGGADPSRRDSLYRATPAEWAGYFGKADVAEFLDALTDAPG